MQFPKILRDTWGVAAGKKPIDSARALEVIFGLSTLVIFLVLVAIISAYRPVPVVRVAPQILPVTEVVAANEPASAPAPAIVPVVLTVPAPAPTAPIDDMIEYRVRHGDTFGALGRQFCFDYVRVARDNGIADPNWIYADKTVLRFKNGCAHAPSVLAKQDVSPRELVRDGGASSGKQIPTLVDRAPEASPLPPVAASAAAPSASMPIRAAAEPTADADKPLSEIYHKEIYRKAALLSIKPEERTKAQNAEIHRLTMHIRHQVLARYPLANPDCLYAEGREIGQGWEEQTLFRARCIRQNFGQTIDETAVERKLEPALIEALIIIESGGQPDAISPTGCTGLKQFCLGSSRLFGLRDRFDPFESIRAGGRHIEDNLRQWGGNVAKATAHFYGGPALVASVGSNATRHPYTQNVLRVKRLIEKETRRVASGQPGLVPVSYAPAR